MLFPEHNKYRLDFCSICSVRSVCANISNKIKIILRNMMRKNDLSLCINEPNDVKYWKKRFETFLINISNTRAMQ